MRRLRPLLIVLAVTAAACSGATAETTTTTTTTVPPTTTTTLPDDLVPMPSGAWSPINGLEAESPELLFRRAVAVKIDNHPDARPQSGLQHADAVIEIPVEGTFTRFIAVYHDNDSDYVGPVRSLRPTDSTLLAAADIPMAISGGQTWIQGLAVSRGVRIMGETAAGLFRVGVRRAPHNLYGDTALIRAGADNRGYPDELTQWLYQVGEWTIPETPATSVRLHWFNNHVVEWEYDGGQYQRKAGGTIQEWLTRDGDRGPIAVDVLVILAGDRYTAFPSGGGSPVPAIDTTGEGAAWVISRGGVWSGTWTRDAIDEPFVLRDPEGVEASVPPGTVWISVFPEHRSVVIK